MVALLLTAVSSALAQDVDAEQGFSSRIASERASRGIGALTPMADLQVVARRHAQRMADRGEPHHNPALGSEVQGWSMVAENVGVGPDVDAIHQRFMESTGHRDNILNPELTELGVGVVRTEDGRIWVVEVFRRPSAAPPPPPPPATTAPPPPAATSPAAPPVVASATTSTPITTTTTTAPLPPAPAAASPLPRASADGGALASSSVRPAGRGRVSAQTSAPVAIAPLARGVPPAVWVAAFLLAGVVGLQGQALHRLGLVA